jgi:signal transduction histidine kinase
MMSKIQIKNRFAAILVSLLLILLIGVLDYISGAEMSFSVFYLIPVLYIAIHDNSTEKIVIFNALVAATVWFFADFYLRPYSYPLIPYWNAFVRFVIFVVVGQLAFNLNQKHKKLADANKKLEHLNEEKNKLIGVAAHDLRNPIGTIFSFSDLLLSNHIPKADSNTGEIIQYIKETSSNTLIMLEKLLDISKIEAGIIDISPKNQDYIAYVKKYVALNQMLADQKKITFRFESDAETMLFPFDEHYLSEVLNNLFTNAIKYSYPESEIVVKVSSTPDDTIKTEVIDTGEGIKKEEQAGLFKYFQRTSTRPTAGEKSTGLGLAIAKKIVLGHKGKIGLKSKRKKGSNFYFELPKLVE